eukprot:GHVP01038990.1.p1 GENE.GHVP01038990.1~~GHVP01038990.1.p1  ORF type:complete len:390 (+),score=41.08 GHVP01038990.1:952-2121(+)
MHFMVILMHFIGSFCIRCSQDLMTEVDIIILLSSCGFKLDQSIAVALGHIRKVVLIVGGKDGYMFGSRSNARYNYPMYMFPYWGAIPIVQAGSRGEYYGLGQLLLGLHEGLLFEYDFVGDNYPLIASAGITNYVPPLCLISEAVYKLRQDLDTYLETPISFSNMIVEGVSSTGQAVSKEIGYGNLIADAFIWRWKQAGISTPVVAMKASTTIFGNLPLGVITARDVAATLYTHTFILEMKCLGSRIRDLLELGLDSWELMPFLQISGMIVTYDSSKAELPRVEEIQIWDSITQTSGTFDDEAEYHVCIDDSASELFGRYAFVGCEFVGRHIPEAAVVTEYIGRNTFLIDHYDGRFEDVSLRVDNSGCTDAREKTTFLCFVLFLWVYFFL